MTVEMVSHVVVKKVTMTVFQKAYLLAVLRAEQKDTSKEMIEVE